PNDEPGSDLWSGPGGRAAWFSTPAAQAAVLSIRHTTASRLHREARRPDPHARRCDPSTGKYSRGSKPEFQRCNSTSTDLSGYRVGETSETRRGPRVVGAAEAAAANAPRRHPGDGATPPGRAVRRRGPPAIVARERRLCPVP